MKRSEFVEIIELLLQNNKSQSLVLLEKIANGFNKTGETDLGNKLTEIIMSHKSMSFCSNDNMGDELILSDDLKDNTQIFLSSVNKQSMLVNKVLFHGHPGTGKTLLASKIANLLNRKIISISYGSIVDSKLGESIKNLEAIFQKYNKTDVILFFDEIDGFSISRNSINDIGEMARITTTLLTLLDGLDPNTIFIASTNMLEVLDKALLRRMDLIFDFNTYTKKNLLEINNYYSDKYNCTYEKGIIKNIILDKKLTIYPYEIKTLYKEINIRKTASFTIYRVINNFMMKKLNFTNQEDLKSYLVNNINYNLISASAILNKKISKSSIANLRNKNE